MIQPLFELIKIHGHKEVGGERNKEKPPTQCEHAHQWHGDGGRLRTGLP